jgi:hypothetical protein
MQWDYVENYDGLIGEIRKGIHHLPIADLICRVQNGRSDFVHFENKMCIYEISYFFEIGELLTLYFAIYLFFS